MDTLGGIPYSCTFCCKPVPKLDSGNICSDCGAVCCSKDCLDQHECEDEDD